MTRQITWFASKLNQPGSFAFFFEVKDFVEWNFLFFKKKRIVGWLLELWWSSLGILWGICGVTYAAKDPFPCCGDSTTAGEWTVTYTFSLPPFYPFYPFHAFHYYLKNISSLFHAGWNGSVEYEREVTFRIAQTSLSACTLYTSHGTPIEPCSLTRAQHFVH